MKKFYYTLIFALLTFSSTQAQKPLRLGLRGGINVGWLGVPSKSILRDASKVGFSYGVIADYKINGWNNLFIGAEFNLTNSNGSFKFKDTTLNFVENPGLSMNSPTYTLKLQYLHIPIYAKFLTNEIGSNGLKFGGEFGVAPSFLIGAKATVTGDFPSGIDPVDYEDIRVNREENDGFGFVGFEDQIFFARLPIIIGIIGEYALGSSGSFLTAGIRYENTFTNIYVKDKNVSAKNHNIGFSVGVLF